MPAVEYKNVLLISGFWNILKILKTTFILALCSPLPNSASGCCGSFYTSTTAAAHCHTSVNIQQWRRRRQRSGEAEAQKPKCSLRSCSPRMKLWSEFLTTLVSFLWLWVGFPIQCLQFWSNLCLAVATLPCPSQKMTGGTPEVSSGKSLTLMTYNIRHSTNGPMDQQTNGPMDQWSHGPIVQWS